MVLLSIDNIHTYYGESHVLQGISLSVEEGEIVSLLGRNGAGKTTTVRSVMGLTPPRRGTIQFNQEDITGLNPERISQAGITLVPEDRDVFPNLTVEENLRLGGLAHGATNDDIERIGEYFPRLSERMAQEAGQMSGGEQQMLAIGRALLTDPDLLLLDEPSEGLAPVIVEDLIDIIKQIREDGVSILLIEQNVKAALELADRHFIIETGRNVFDGTTEQIRDREELMEQTLGVDSRESSTGKMEDEH